MFSVDQRTAAGGRDSAGQDEQKNEPLMATNSDWSSPTEVKYLEVATLTSR
jgi:hypothetical protein